MTIKELILNDMPDNLNKLEKARYIYIKLGNILSFSTKFNNTIDVESINMRINKIDVTKFNQNEVNCIMWSDLYKYLLDEVNIKNEIINQGHRYVEFYIDNKRWIADATHGNYTDLARIHNDDETMYFGVSLYQNQKHGNFINLSDEDMLKLKSVDNKLGYNILNEGKINDLKKTILDIRNKKFNFEEILGNNISFLEKVEYLFCKLGILRHGYYESKDFVYYLERLVFSNDELKNIKAVELKRTNKNKEVDIIQCISVFDNGKYNYYLLSPNNPIIKVSKEQITKLSLLGYGIEKNKKIPEINFPKVFKVGKVSNYKLCRIINKNKIIEYGLKAYDEEQFKKIM